MNLFGSQEENIMIEEYSKNPINNREMLDFSVKYHEGNFICGDDINAFIKIHNDVVQEFSYTGNLSMVALSVSSFLAEYIIGTKIGDILNWNFEFLREKGFNVSNRRKRAVVLPLLAIRNAIHQHLNDGIMDDFDDLLD